MKRIFMVLVVTTTTLVNAQFGINFGIKGNALIRASSSSWTAEDNSKLSGTKDQGGLNIGVFSKIKVPIPFIPIFFMPEVYFTQYKSGTTYTISAEIEKQTISSDIKLSANSFRVDIPILIGYDIMGIGGIFAGPVFYNQIRELNKSVSKLQAVQGATGGDISDIKQKASQILSENYGEEYISKKTGMGYQIGISLDFIPKLTINARYEVASKEDKRVYTGKINKDAVYYTEKPKFFIVGAGFKF